MEMKGAKLRMRNRCRKSSTFRCNAGSRCSLSILVWILVGLVITVHVYSLVSHREVGKNQVRLSHFPLTREIEEVEEENFQIPPPRGKRSPRTAKRRGNRKPTLIDEFLDDSSQLRHLFFPDHKTAVDPMRVKENDSLYYYPSSQWLDTDGNTIQAHGGGIIYVERTGTYYWYGENKGAPTYQAHSKGAARMQSQVAKALRNVVVQLIRQQSQAAYGGDSPMQALKKALDKLPQDSMEVTHPLKSRSTHLMSANQTIQEALTTAEKMRRRYSDSTVQYLLYLIASSCFLDFPTKRALLDLLLAASSETESQVDKSFAKLIDDALMEDACGLSGQYEEQIMADITTNHEMIRALIERLLHAKEGRLREDDLRCYPEAFANAILDLGVSMPSLEAAEAAVVAAAERWTGTSHTREEVTEFVHTGQMKIRSWTYDAFNRAVESATAFSRVKKCPLNDIMDALCQVPPASDKAHLLIDHLVLYSKPPPLEYCSMRKSYITLFKLYASSSTSSIKHMHEADVEEFACFFAPQVLLPMNSIVHGHDENASSSRIESSSPFPHQQGFPWPSSMEERVDGVLRDALVDTARRLEDMSSEGSSSYSNTTLLERLVCQISFSAPSTLKRELLRQVLHDSRTSPPESVVDEAFRRIITVSVERINGPSRSSKKLIDLLQDAILHDHYSSIWEYSSMKQALIERLVFVGGNTIEKGERSGILVCTPGAKTKG